MAGLGPDRRDPGAARAVSGARSRRARQSLGARGIYLYVGNKDTLYRIHGTNQPEYIGQAISSGCIRMRNEDVIDLYDRVKLNSTVVVLPPGQGSASRGRPQLARVSAGFCA